MGRNGYLDEGRESEEGTCQIGGKRGRERAEREIREEQREK